MEGERGDEGRGRCRWVSWLALSPQTTMKSSWQGLWATDMTVNGTVAVLNLCTTQIIQVLSTPRVVITNQYEDGLCMSKNMGNCLRNFHAEL